MAKTVIYIGAMELPDKNAAAQRVLTNSKAISAIGYNVVLIGMNKEMGADKRDSKYRYMKVSGFDCYEVPYPKNNVDWAQHMISNKNIISIINKYNEDEISSIILYNYYSLASLGLIKLTRKKNIQIISDCTEWYGKSGNIFKKLDNYLRMRFINIIINNIICISDYLEQHYSGKGCNTVNIPSLVDSSDSKWKKTFKYEPSSERTFSYVGSPGIKEGKDRLDMIIESFSMLDKRNNKYELNIVGISKKDFLGFYPHLEKSLNNKMVFWGRLPHQSSIEILKKSDFSIFSRDINRVTTAGFPTKLGESFACGVPVITNPTSNISRFIIEGQNGFLSEDFTANSLSRAIEKALLVNDNDLVQMHDFCLKNNNLDYKKYLDEFKSLLNK